MKKMLLVLGVAAAAMTSCTNDQTLELNSNSSIDFSAFVGKSTRSVTDTDNDLSKFYVFGYYGENYANEAFDNVSVTNGASTGVIWTANDYIFAAYADKNVSSPIPLTAEFVPTTKTLTISEFQVSETTDLVAAITNNVDNKQLSNPNVDLTFNHMLSKVKFTIRNTADGLTMKVSNIVVSGLTDKGTCTYTTAPTPPTPNISWVPLDGTDNYSIIYDGTTTDIEAPVEEDDGDKTYLSYTSEEFLVIPQGLTNIIAEFTIQFFDANGNMVDEIAFTGRDAVSLNANANSVTTWQGGVVYNYCTDMPASPSTITFKVREVNGWPDDDTTLDDVEPDEDVDF